MKKRYLSMMMWAAVSYLLQLPVSKFFPLLISFGTCYTYVGALFMIPISFPRYLVLLLGLLIGLAADGIYGHWGEHAAASVLCVYARQWWLDALYQGDSQSRYFQVSQHQIGKISLVAYVCSLVCMHHTAIFLIEAGNWQFFLRNFVTASVSTLYSTCFVLLIFLLLSVRQKYSLYE